MGLNISRRNYTSPLIDQKKNKQKKLPSLICRKKNKAHLWSAEQPVGGALTRRFFIVSARVTDGIVLTISIVKKSIGSR